MPVTHAISDDMTCLVITIVGPFTLATACEVIYDLVPVLNTAGIHNVLVDARQQEAPLDMLSAHEIGLALAQPTLRQFSIAVVIPDPLLQPHHIETVAVNRGGNVRYFDDYDQALAWLKASPGHSTPVAESPNTTKARPQGAQ